MSENNETTNSNSQEETTTTAEPSLATEQTNNEADSAAENTNSETTAEEFVPITSEDITFPEGVEVDEAFRDEALAVFNNRELSPKEQMQALVDLQLKAAQSASETISKTWEDTQTQWRDEVKADKEIGGDKLPEVLGRVGRLIDEYGTVEVKQAFDLTGAGNNVHVIRMLDKVAQKLTEGGPVSGTPATTNESVAKSLFPSMN